MIVAVKTDPSERHRGVSLIVIERGMEGFERGRNLEKVGQHSQDTAELFFNDMHVPVENLLGEEGQGFRYLVSNLAQERLSIAVQALGAARAGLVETIEYTKRRTAFGQSIASFQNSRFVLAECHAEIEVARRTSTAASRRWGPASSPARTPPSPSGGRPRCRGACSIAASSCTAATATWPSTRSPGPGPTRA